MPALPASANDDTTIARSPSPIPEQKSEAVQRGAPRSGARNLMERAGIEPATSGLQSRRSPS